jgi:DNA-binding NarL/FixJ family response regulator
MRGVKDASTVVEEARSRLRAGDSAGARRLLEHVDAEDGAVLECKARAHYLDLDFAGAADAWERAYAGYRAEGNQLGAVRVARTLGFMHGILAGDAAVMQGWLARAQTLLAPVGDDVERGWVALTKGMFAGDRARKDAEFREALAIARARGDTDLEVVALAYLGASLVHGDRTEEGMLLLDEALAAVAGREVDDFFILQDIFCQLFSACEHAQDVARADQWIRVGEAIATRRNLPAVSAFCHTHYGGLLTAAGRWPEADAALSEAVRAWALGFGSLRAGALVRLAELRVRQGRYEEAERLLDGIEHHVEAARPLAAVHLARGDIDAATDVLHHALRQLDPASGAAGPLLALLVDVRLAAGDLEGARTAAAGVERCATGRASDYLAAVAALARGQVCLATGDGDPAACLRDALAGFDRAQLPMELARARLALANALADGRPAAAMAEARSALEAFDRLQAARDADAAAALLRRLGGKAQPAGRRPGTLSKREAEVLDLLGHGLSNPEIADRLYISRKTVEHHVGNILAKLGLRSRAEAAAYAIRAKPAQE